MGDDVDTLLGGVRTVLDGFYVLVDGGIGADALLVHAGDEVGFG